MIIKGRGGGGGRASELNSRPTNGQYIPVPSRILSAQMYTCSRESLLIRLIQKIKVHCNWIETVFIIEGKYEGNKI